jgi:outer membrane protein assembly factor BamB
LADGKLYAVRENGTVYVCDVTDGMTLLAENELEGPVVATPVPAGDSILIRTRTHLYRFGK